MPKFGIGFSRGAKGSKEDSDSSSDTSDGQGGRIKRKLKMPSGGVGISAGAKGPKADDGSDSDTSDGEGGRIKRKLKLPSGEGKAEHDDGKHGFKFKMPKFGFGNRKSKDKSKKEKHGDIRLKGDIELPDAELEGGIQPVSVDNELHHEPPSVDLSGSDTSDGEGGRIKRKLKLPKGGIDISGGIKKDGDSDSDTSDGHGGRIKRKLKVPSGGIDISGGRKEKGDSDSGSDTSDGQGGRIKRKLKLPSGRIGISGGIKGPKADDSGSETSDGEGGRIKRKYKMTGVTAKGDLKGKGDHKKKKFKLPKFRLGSRKDKKSRESKESDSETSDDEVELKKKFEIPTVDIDVKASKPDDSGGSETSDGHGGKIKRKLKIPVVGGIKGKKGDSSSSSDTSDGEGGRIKRKLKAPKGEFGTFGGIKEPKVGDGSGSETSDGEGGRIKRKLKLSKFSIGVSGIGSKEVSDSDTSDGEGGRIRRKFKAPKGEIGISDSVKEAKALDSGSETSDGKGGRIKRHLKTPAVTVEGDFKDEDSQKKKKFKLPKFRFGSGKKDKKSKKIQESDSDMSEDEAELKKKFEIPVLDVDVNASKLEDSGSETSDGHGGRIKRKLKIPGFGISGGVNEKTDSKTSDGEEGRTRRKLKASKDSTAISSDVKGPKADSDSEISDGEGGKIKRKLKMPKLGYGISASKKEPKEGITQEAMISSTDKNMNIDPSDIGLLLSDLDVQTLGTAELGTDHSLMVTKPKPVVEDVPTLPESTVEVQSMPEEYSFSAPSGSFGNTNIEYEPHSRPSGRIVSTEFVPSPIEEVVVRSTPKTVDVKSDIDFSKLEADFVVPSDVDKKIGVSSEQKTAPMKTNINTAYLTTSAAHLQTNTSDTDNAVPAMNIHDMGSDDIKQFILRNQQQGHSGLSTSLSGDASAADPKSIVTRGVMVPEMETHTGPSFSSSSKVQTSSTTVTQTYATRIKTTESSSASFGVNEPSGQSMVETKVETSSRMDHFEMSMDTMNPSDIKQLIFTSSRTGRLSLPSEKDASGGQRRPVSMDVSRTYGAPKTSSVSFSGRSQSTENLAVGKVQLPKPITVILKGDDDSKSSGTTTTSVKAKSSVTQQSDSTSYQRVVSRQGDTGVGFEGLKGIAAEEHQITHGTTTKRSISSSSTKSSSSSTSSRITMTSQSHVRKVPSLSRTFPELLDEEIRQVKASSEKSDVIEDRRRWSLEKRSEWMLSSPSSEPDAEGAQKRLTLRERKRLLLGHDVDDDSQKDKPSS